MKPTRLTQENRRAVEEIARERLGACRLCGTNEWRYVSAHPGTRSLAVKVWCPGCREKGAVVLPKDEAERLGIV